MAPIQPQVAPQSQQQAPMQPQAQPQQAPAQAQPASKAAMSAKNKPSGRTGQGYNPDLLPIIEQHLNALPDQQKKFLASYMTPELAILFGIVLGQEAFDYFKHFVNPAKTLIVQDKQQQNPAQQSGNAGQSGGTPAMSPQPQANPPARTIMGR